jgi:lipoyl(octanoyl) transferase
MTQSFELSVPGSQSLSHSESELTRARLRQLFVVDLGTMSYGPALDLQREMARARIEGRLEEDMLLLVEHPPVVTLGRGSRDAHLLASPELLAARGVERFEVERGGDVTFHGPGQLVGYPIIDLKRHRQDLHWYLRQVEEALIGALARYGLAGERNAGFTGVWTRGGDAATPTARPRKIASIGVHARDWVTWHGFALNVSTDLSYFDFMVPCGIPGVEMTSLARELGRDDLAVAGVAKDVAEAFGSVFGLTIVRRTLASLPV